MKYQSVVVGGTFDRLHIGHKALLEESFALGEYVTIGLTTDLYVKTYKKQLYSPSDQSAQHTQSGTIASQVDREKALRAWLDQQGWNGRYEICPLDDPYGPTVERKYSEAGEMNTKIHTSGKRTYQAIVVSEESMASAEKMNEMRKQSGQPPLIIHVISMVPAEDQTRVSATRVRNGQIDSDGRLVMPAHLRMHLKKSIGDIVLDSELPEVLKQDAEQLILTVGDMTTKKILAYGYRPQFAAIDFQIERVACEWDKPTFDLLTKGAQVFEFKSGPGYISDQVMHVIQEWGKHCQNTPRPSATVLIIDGEEDLLVLPLLAVAPIGSVVYYGQPKKGLVRVEVTVEQKASAQELLKTFAAG